MQTDITFEELVDFEYIGGGDFRKKGFARKGAAPVLHAFELLRLVHQHIKVEGLPPLCQGCHQWECVCDAEGDTPTETTETVKT